MRNVLATLIPAALLLPGCLCGGYEGQDDRVLRTENGDAMQLCSNGGYAVMMANGTILEGRLDYTDGIAASAGETGARAFTLTNEVDGSMSSPELGAGWIPVVLDKTELDHAHIQCTDLASRAWWSTSTGSLPEATAFTKPIAEFPTIEACHDAQGAGEFPMESACADEVMFCTDGSALMSADFGGVKPANYTASGGKVTLYNTANSFEGIYTAGKLTAGTTTWTKTAVTEVSAALRCAPTANQ